MISLTKKHMIQFDQTLGKNTNSRWKNDDLMFARLVIDRLIFQIIGYYKIFILIVMNQ